MPASQRIPEITLRTNNRLHGFTVESVTTLSDIRMVAYQLLHGASGARVLHLHAEDPENLFAIAFRTPPPDDTGLPHILEHTVLCGSQKYPVKDPFVELLKSSLATFLNAMTYPDKTVYPCASIVERDFFNLAEVYCDAVFHPLITEKHFKQEGHHFDFAEPGNPNSSLIIKGIVYNEMKGVYSDLDGIIERHISRSVCPDNAYGRDSGGDPEVIPTLTYERFKAFHETYYHPSNALIFIYGNVPTEKHLDFLNRTCLSAFDRILIDTHISAQPRWSEPSHDTIPYPIGPNDELTGKTAVVLTFLTNDVTEAIRSLSMNVIDYYLLGNAASPLRKALIDSKLGEELTDSGYASFQRDTFFTVGLKGTEAEHTDEIVDLIMTTCKRLAEEGFEKSKVEAAFHRLELSSREIQGHYPLHLMDRVYRSWIYDADPLYHLRLNEHLVELRSHFETEDRFFERQLAEMIVENPHRSVLTFVPERDYVAKRDEAFRSKMEAMKRSMGEADLKRILEEAEALNIIQSTANSPEALATLPRLSLSDVPKEPQYLQTTIEEIIGVPFLHTDIFSNGVNYLNLAFDLRGIDDALIEYLPLYAEALRKMGAGDDDYVVMAEREAASTGGVNTGLSANGRVDDPIYVQPFLFVSSNSLDAKVPEMLEIVAQRIMKCDLTDMERLKDVVLQARVAVRSQIIPNGSSYALGHAGRNLSRNAFLSERMGGVTHVRLLDSLIENFDAVKKDLKGKLEGIRDFIMARGRLTASFVGGDDQLRMVRDFLADFLLKLGGELPPEEASEFSPRMSTREAVATPADVAFVAAAFPVVGAAHEEAPALLLLSTHLSYGYLWDQIRVKGGAYGARAVYDPLNGLFGFSSYRDPFIKETLQAYRGVFDYVANEMDLTPPAVEKAIIGTIKTLDRSIRPGQAVGLALLRYLKGETDDFRRAFRARLMSLTGDELRRVCLKRLKPGFNTAPICVLSSREKLTAANETLTPDTLAIVDL